MDQSPASEPNATVRLHITLPAAVLQKLDQAVFDNYTTRSVIINWALLEWLANQRPASSAELFPRSPVRQSSLSVQQIVALARKGVTVDWNELAFKPAFNTFIGKEELSLQEMQDALTLYEEADFL